MKFNQWLLAAALVVGGSSAHAADQVVDLSSGHASFVGSGPLLQGGDDVLTFVNLAAGTYDFQLSFSAQNIGGLTADLNGEASHIVSFGNFTFGGLESRGNAPFVLTFSGHGGDTSAYSGEFRVTPVPEPATYGMLLAGLGIVGFLARRRRG